MYQKLSWMTKTCRYVVALRKLSWVICAWLLTSVTMPSAALAQGAIEPSGAAEAKRLYAQGAALYVAGQYGEALDVLQNSYKLVPSPNSELVIARCLRELGRLVEAQERFVSAELEARRRAAEGAPKYAQTANSAATEGAAVRSVLGTIRIQIAGLEPDTKVAVDGVTTDVPPEGELIVWHTTGEATISMRSASGLEQKQVVTVRAGAEVTVGFGRPEPAPPPEPRAPVRPPPEIPGPATGNPAEPIGHLASTSSQGANWAEGAAVASGAVAVLGAGMFAGFRFASHAAYQDLFNTCGKTVSCGPADLPKANAGKTDLVIANISLAVGSVAAAATVTFVVIALSRPSPAATSHSGQWRLLVGAATIGIARQFQ
jgi:hypothetical protein